MTIKYKEHTADIEFQVTSINLEEAFKESAHALTNSLTKEKISEKITKKIHVKGTDEKNLLYNFLEELLFLFDSELFILSKIISLKIKNLELKATLKGDTTENYTLDTHIKAVTYSNMTIKKTDSKVKLNVVLDI